jgi:hypothetical protein
VQNHRALLQAVTLRSLMLSAVFAIIFLILFRSGAPPYLLGLLFGSGAGDTELQTAWRDY